MDIDAVIAEATAQDALEAKAETTKVEEAPKVEAEQKQEPKEPEQGESEELAAKPDSELTPEQLAKREANRYSHRRSREARLRRELRELREFKASLEKKPAPEPVAKDDAPKEEDFDSFLDFVKATARYEAKQEYKPRESEPQAPVVDQKQVERISQIANQVTEFAQRTPEYLQLYQQHRAFMDNLPEQVEAAIYEAENAPLALYALMKEGGLEDLEDLPPMRIAMELGRAEERGKRYLETATRTTNAPPPITPLKGTAKGSKSIEQMSADELLSWVAS